MSVKPLAFFLTSLVVLMPLAGCFGTEIDNTNLEETNGVFNFEKEPTTWYHYPGGDYAENNTSGLTGNNIPYYSKGTYYSTGFSTFEPTMGITSTDNIYSVSYTHLTLPTKA